MRWAWAGLMGGWACGGAAPEPTPAKPDPGQTLGWDSGTAATPSDSAVPPDLPLPERFERLKALASDRFEVGEGAFEWLTYEACCDPGVSCLWNNPSTPYGLMRLPSRPEATAPDGGVQPDGLARYPRLRRDEAVVLIGQSPPESRYFGIRSYVATRWDPTLGLPTMALGSLGAMLNQQVAEQLLGSSPFAAPMAVLTTGDAAVEAEVQALLRQAGFAAGEVWPDRIAPGAARFGLDAASDTFMFVTRVAVISDPTAEAAFRADPGWQVLRLTPREERPERPLPPPILPPRGTGQTEEAWRPALDALEAAALARFSDFRPVRQDSWEIWFETLSCLAEDGFCSGDSRDRYYARVPNLYLPGDESFALVYGVNHERTGKASYSNFAADTVINEIGLFAVDSREMVGSARALLPDHPQVDDLYAWVVARDCAAFPDLRCTPLPTGCPGVDPDEPFFFSFRAYLEPATGAAPIERELVVDRVIRFGAP